MLLQLRTGVLSTSFGHNTAAPQLDVSFSWQTYLV
jgi:hypothetical protein